MEIPPSVESTIRMGPDVKCWDQRTWPTLMAGVDDAVSIGDGAVQPSRDLLADGLSPPAAAGGSAAAGLWACSPPLRRSPAHGAALGISGTSRVAVSRGEGVAKQRAKGSLDASPGTLPGCRHGFRAPWIILTGLCAQAQLVPDRMCLPRPSFLPLPLLP
ncbi:unnamed protein product [Prorocentrum cordatum]|uniref:Uncharacterized protein n=1 Tax=Prorocentrum cordatum TaxID=2364126 RepID=A0ABN9WQ45_9DINO|nr:unnamed protein product [Polarella glacialis]